MHLSENCVSLYFALSFIFFSSLSNTCLVFSCVNTSRCSTGSATTKNCSCRVTQRLAWATNMPWTYRRSTITLPWIPWWVEGMLWTMGLCAREWGRGWHVRPPPVQRALWTCERWREGGQAGLWQQPSSWEAECCSVHPDTDIWLFPWLKSSTVLWSLFTFWRANTIFLKFLTFLWLGINESCRWHLNNLCFYPHTLLRYFSKPWTRDVNQAVSCGHSGIFWLFQ